jgi:ketosteroid isomerase-like protein
MLQQVDDWVNQLIKRKEMMKTKSVFLLFWLIIAVSPFSPAQTANTLEQELMHLEQQRIDAVTRGDLPALERIFADDLLYTHSNARQETKQQFLESVKSGNIKYEAMKHSDLKVQLFGDTAVLRGKSDIKGIANGQSFAFPIRFITVYVKRNGRWQMTVWQSTRAEK